MTTPQETPYRPLPGTFTRTNLGPGNPGKKRYAGISGRLLGEERARLRTVARAKKVRENDILCNALKRELDRMEGIEPGDQDVRRPISAELSVVQTRDDGAEETPSYRGLQGDPKPTQRPAHCSGHQPTGPNPVDPNEGRARLREDHPSTVDSPGPWWSKPRFPEKAYEDNRGDKIKATRIAIWEEFGAVLESIDEGAASISKNASEEAWLDCYEASLSRLQREKREAQERAEAEAARITALSTPKPVTLATLMVEVIDPKIKETYKPEQIEKFLEENPVTTREDFERLEDKLIDQIEEAEEKRAQIEGGACMGKWHDDGRPRQYEGFLRVGAVAAVKRVQARHERERQERKEFRTKRAGKLSPEDKRVITAAVTVAPQLRQEGDPRKHFVDHQREYRQLTGRGASAFETTTEPTREKSNRELRDIEKRKPKPDSS